MKGVGGEHALQGRGPLPSLRHDGHVYAGSVRAEVERAGDVGDRLSRDRVSAVDEGFRSVLEGGVECFAEQGAGPAGCRPCPPTTA